MTTPQIDEDVLVMRGRVLSRYDMRPKFAEVRMEFPGTDYDTEAQVASMPETLRVVMNEDGRFDLKIKPRTNGHSFIGKAVFVTFDGQVHVDYRTLPATGIVDWFACPRATSIDNTRWPNGETPILTSDYNKPGGPLQLTNNGTIGDRHIPGDFLRVDDPRVEHLDLKNYLTKLDYEADQLTRRSITVPFSGTSVWEYTHNLGYRPLVECIDQGGDVIVGGVSYPDTTTVRVEWDAPTSGTLIVR